MNKLVYLLVAIGGFVVLYGVGRAWKLKPETKYDHRLTLGERAVVGGEAGSRVWLARNEPDGYALNVAMSKKDEAQLKSFEARNAAFAVEAGTAVVVKAEKVSRLKVEVMEGPRKGEQGWAEFEYLRPRHAGEQ